MDQKKGEIMKLKNGAEYMESLRKLNPVIYYKGQKIRDVTRHPATAPHVRSAAMTYALASDDEYRELATATSHLTGRTISRFTHVHQNIENLIKKIKPSSFLKSALRLLILPQR